MNIELAKENMIKQQIRPLGVPYGDLLSTIIDTPREIFVPKSFKELAYSEVEILLNHGQKELTPQTVIKMLQQLAPKRHERALELGCGCGYLTALLAKLTKLIDVVSEHEDMLNHVKNALKTIGVYNAKYHLGVTKDAKTLTELVGLDVKFDVIVVHKYLTVSPENYLKYLAGNGRMLYFLAKGGYAKAVLIHKNVDGSYHQTSTFDVYENVDKKMQAKKAVFKF
ncbi:protein-L-isoaspartate O-methyltransferase family protein [Fastidiosibacter lacustris]|uniref:protein-L-isoaspartate O-methyltransferase family protein n=1 Tax=Fastidiosibacter lacustris TaxID=2056695 RepID=UPI000E34B8AF|nr:DUF938 domain-containing protein [Fastidiosibacter lacustris]